MHPAKDRKTSDIPDSHRYSFQKIFPVKTFIIQDRISPSTSILETPYGKSLSFILYVNSSPNYPKQFYNPITLPLLKRKIYFTLLLYIVFNTTYKYITSHKKGSFSILILFFRRIPSAIPISAIKNTIAVPP